MHFIKLSAISSTNDYLKKRVELLGLTEITLVSAERQTAGRGQQGNKWLSEAGKNLTFSILIKNIPMSWVTDAQLSMAVSLMVLDTLKHFLIPDLAVKWPNDILSGTKKISGILIENIFSEYQTCHAIIGVGINVNQSDFKNLPQASSMKNISGKIYDKEEVLSVFVKYFKQYHKLMQSVKIEIIKNKYHENLFRLNKASTFQDATGNKFTGIIRGVGQTGKLKIEVADKKILSYHHKEVFLCY